MLVAIAKTSRSKLLRRDESLPNASIARGNDPLNLVGDAVAELRVSSSLRKRLRGWRSYNDTVRDIPEYTERKFKDNTADIARAGISRGTIKREIVAISQF